MSARRQAPKKEEELTDSISSGGRRERWESRMQGQNDLTFTEY